jgi:hypothetical protein
MFQTRKSIRNSRSIVCSIPPMKIHYNDTYWESILGADARKMPLERRLEMVFSLLIFLQISIAKHLRFIFTSKIDEVKARSSRFMGFTPTAKDEDTKFPPGMVFRAWLKNFPDAQEHMNDVVAPFAQAIVGKESDKMIQDVQLKVKKDLVSRSWDLSNRKEC